jgi:hypothetical protein
MRISLSYFCLILLVLLAGCTAPQVGCVIPIDNDEIPGRYVANHKKVLLDMVEIRADGTYTYQYKTVSGDDDFTNTGTWIIEDHAGRTYITFNKFVFVLPGYGSGRPAYWPVEPLRSLTGSIRLTLDPDLGYYYVKQEPLAK